MQKENTKLDFAEILVQNYKNIGCPCCGAIGNMYCEEDCLYALDRNTEGKPENIIYLNPRHRIRVFRTKTILT